MWNIGTPYVLLLFLLRKFAVGMNVVEMSLVMDTVLSFSCSFVFDCDHLIYVSARSTDLNQLLDA